MFVTSEGRPGARLQRALAARNLTAAEQAAFEIPFISLAQARELVELYAEKGAHNAVNESAATRTKSPDYRGFSLERMKGLEPSTFCMARTVREQTATVLN